MSRLTELEEQTAIGLLARLRAQQAEMKVTPQLTSVNLKRLWMTMVMITITAVRP